MYLNISWYNIYISSPSDAAWSDLLFLFHISESLLLQSAKKRNQQIKQ